MLIYLWCATLVHLYFTPKSHFIKSSTLTSSARASLGEGNINIGSDFACWQTGFAGSLFAQAAGNWTWATHIPIPLNFYLLRARRNWTAAIPTPRVRTTIILWPAKIYGQRVQIYPVASRALIWRLNLNRLWNDFWFCQQFFSYWIFSYSMI